MKKYFTGMRVFEWITAMIPLIYLIIRFNIVMLLFLVADMISILVGIVIYRREKDVIDERNHRAITQSYGIGFTCMAMTTLLLFFLNSDLLGSPISRLSTDVLLIGIWVVGSLSRNISEYYFRYIE